MECDTSEVNNLRQKCENLLERLEGEVRIVESGDESFKVGVEQLHSEISDLQDSFEKCCLFKEGQNLYSNWLQLVRANNNQPSDPNGIKTTKPDVNSNLIALAFNNRGYLKYLEVDFEGAIQDYTASLKYNATLPSAYYNRGLVFYRLAFFDQAVQDMTAAVNLNPASNQFKEGLARVKEMVGSPNSKNFKLEYRSADEIS